MDQSTRNTLPRINRHGIESKGEKASILIKHQVKEAILPHLDLHRFLV